MRKLILLSAFLLFAATAALCQERQADILIGRGLSLSEAAPSPGGIYTLSFAYRHDAGFVGIAADVPASLSGTPVVGLRAGFRLAILRASFTPYLTLRGEWDSGFRQPSAGYGTVLGFRLFGPVGVFLQASRVHPIGMGDSNLTIDRHGTSLLSAGIQLSI